MIVPSLLNKTIVLLATSIYWSIIRLKNLIGVGYIATCTVASNIINQNQHAV